MKWSYCIGALNYEPLREKTRSSGFPTRFATNWAVQSQKMARSLKFWIKEEEGLYYPSCENKGVISCAVTAKLICAFFFA